MGGLCDEKTAAMLVAHDLGAESPKPQEFIKINDITLEKRNVSFTGKVMDVYEMREFSRDDGSSGRVANIIVSDDTGSIRVVLWDELADLVKVDEIKVGQMVGVSGYVKEGYSGLEVSIGRGGSLKFIEGGDIPVKIYKIGDIKAGMSGINLAGKVLDVSDMRAFSRKDGSNGRVRNITIGDETGKIRVTLWGDAAKDANFAVGDVVEIANGYSKESFNQTEIYIGDRGSISVSGKNVEYAERVMKIGDIGVDESCDVIGVVTEIESKREFNRNDGSLGKVANIRIADETGGIRAVLWGKHADVVDGISIGTKVKITDGYAKAGWNDEVELNVGWRGKVSVLEHPE
jgi:replication factor A1